MAVEDGRREGERENGILKLFLVAGFKVIGNTSFGVVESWWADMMSMSIGNG